MTEENHKTASRNLAVKAVLPVLPIPFASQTPPDSQWRFAVLKDTGNIGYYMQTHRHNNCKLILLNENNITCFHYYDSNT